MKFESRDDGDYRIHAGSLEARTGGGHLAAVVVDRLGSGRADAREVFRDTALAGGQRWATADQALRQALALGASAVAEDRARHEADVNRLVAGASARPKSVLAAR